MSRAVRERGMPTPTGAVPPLPPEVCERLASVWADILVADYYARHPGPSRDATRVSQDYDSTAGAQHPCIH